MCADILDNETELDELFSLVEPNEMEEEGEILSAVGSSTEEPRCEPGLAPDEEGSHGERRSEGSPSQGLNLINTPKNVQMGRHKTAAAAAPPASDVRRLA